MTEIFLLPGRLATLSGRGVVRTVLGSCIAVVLYDPAKLLAGVNHYLLPEPSSESDRKNRLKYGVFAIPDLVQALVDMGSAPSRLRAEIYGGAAVVDHLVGSFTIGDKNIDLAESCLAQLRIPIVAADVGGQNGRKIAFHLPGCQTEIKFIRNLATGS
ncbi:chemotaxis protein CheD [Oligoflexus tunisiensis]|uniref:chemotaxis protein CheD n=1 Tax=Oligoflexus tunisiensis TaxID=708132 RepID=UPI00114CC267|nr:chemotaxis protein CheD [Oligoflexus tunisiensis]